MKCLYSSFVFGICGILSIVTNKKETLLGTINDGDVRRAILKNAKLSSTILKYYKKNCYFIRYKELSKINTSEKLKKLKINLIPIHNKSIPPIIFNPEINKSVEAKKTIITLKTMAPIAP